MLSSCLLWCAGQVNDAVMDRLLTAGLCGNTLGQDIQTLTYHSSTSNIAFHVSDVCSSNFTWPLNMMSYCAIEVFVWRVKLNSARCRTHLLLKSQLILVIQIKVT